MPRALATIEKASDLLETACKEMKRDPYSKGGRDHLITGSRGILQGTTAMLVTFDESQVRKICRDCKKVRDYLAISEVIETMEDLVQFVKDLSPSLSKVCLDVEGRRNDLLNPYQRDNLGQHLEQVKTLAPILICSMKIFIQILGKEGKGTEEAVENRNYLAKRMADEVAEIQRLLEESTCVPSDGSELGAGNGSASVGTAEMTFHELLKKVNSSLASKSVGSMSQQSLRQVVEQGFKIADGFEGRVKSELIETCNELDRASRQMGQNAGNPKARRAVSELVRRLELRVSEAVIDRIIQVRASDHLLLCLRSDLADLRQRGIHYLWALTCELLCTSIYRRAHKLLRIRNAVFGQPCLEQCWAAAGGERGIRCSSSITIPRAVETFRHHATTCPATME